ncbi:hypothetical protein NXX77_10530 [Phocaeicola dorei]|nr:hypothetical protein [Phocaeicola dorei]
MENQAQTGVDRKLDLRNREWLTVSFENYQAVSPQHPFPGGSLVPPYIDSGGLDYYTERNNFQLPAYHRLDLGINIYSTKEKEPDGNMEYQHLQCLFLHGTRQHTQRMVV